MKKFFLLCALVLAVIVGGAEPLLRFGAISDNHLDAKHPDSWERTKMAFEFFKKQKVVFFVDSGDVTNTYQPEMFKLWRKMYLEVFDDEKSRPDFLMIPAGHDKSGAESTAKGYAEFVRLTGSGAVNPVKVVNGFHFVSLAQWENLRILQKNLEAAVAASKPGQPVFVITHVPPTATTSGSGLVSRGNNNLRSLLNKYPQVITLSGHTHNRLIDERSIWQGEFTAVNLGSLAYCGNGGIANPTDRPTSYDASIWEVYADRVIVRRFNLRSGKELFPDKPWQFPLPFDKATAPYRMEVRQKLPVPSFNAGQKVGFKPEFMGNLRWGKLVLPLPDVEPMGVLGYSVKVEVKNSKGDFEHFGIISFTRWQLPGKVEEFAFPAGYLDADRDYRVTVTPLGYYGGLGNPIVGEFSVGKVPWKECPGAWNPVWNPWKSAKILPVDADGFVAVNGDVRGLLPGEAARYAIKNNLKNVCVSMDIECIGKGKGASLRISNNRNQIISQNTADFRTTPQKQRFAFQFRPQAKDKSHYLLIRRGDFGKYRISNVKCFVY